MGIFVFGRETSRLQLGYAGVVGLQATKWFHGPCMHHYFYLE
jgi:hypothetical protein